MEKAGHANPRIETEPRGHSHVKVTSQTSTAWTDWSRAHKANPHCYRTIRAMTIKAPWALGCGCGAF